jgi:hypothetical protein
MAIDLDCRDVGARLPVSLWTDGFPKPEMALDHMGERHVSIVWLIASILFSWYASNFGSYNATYGSLGAAIGMMTWMWISSIVIIMGAELNAEIEKAAAEPHAQRRDSSEHRTAA